MARRGRQRFEGERRPIEHVVTAVGSSCSIRFALRYLARNAGFATLAVVMLALGMMATTAMYSVVLRRRAGSVPV